MNFLRPLRVVLLSALAFAAFAPTPLRADTEMELTFERVEKAYKKLKTGLEAPSEANKASYVKLAEEIGVQTRKARDLDPKMTASLPEEKREAFLKDFRGQMDDMIGDVDKLTEALKNGKWDEAKKLLVKIHDAEEEGHKKFRPKKKKKQ